jgi:hypothetical protein
MARWSAEVRVSLGKCGEQELSKNLQRQNQPDENGLFFAAFPMCRKENTSMKNSATSGQRQNHGADVSKKSSNNASPDMRLSHHGTVVLFHPLTDSARDWMREHCPADCDHTYFGSALVVEPRYVESVLFHAGEDGLLV